MTNAPGTKKKSAAITHRLIEEGPLWPAAAIQRGPSTVAMLNSITSQKPMVLRSSGLEPDEDAAAVVIVSPEFPKNANAVFGHDKWIAVEDSLASNNTAVRFRLDTRTGQR